MSVFQDSSFASLPFFRTHAIQSVVGPVLGLFTQGASMTERGPDTSIFVIPQVGVTAVQGYRSVVGQLRGLARTAHSGIGQGLYTVWRYRPANGILAGPANWSSREVDPPPP